MKAATQHLVDHGIRPSVQRVAIMKYLMEHHTHPTVDVIYGDLHPDMPTLSRTTVYNTLQLLTERRAVLTLGIDGHMSHYDGFIEPHAHFMCRKCGCIIDLPLSHKKLIAAHSADGLVIERAEVDFIGLCSSCK